MSVNFEFLKTHDPIIAEMAGFAEQYFAPDPMTCLIKSRQVAEALIKQTAARVGLWTNDREELFRVIQRLQSQGVFDTQITKLFHGLRDKGNIAAHQFLGGHSEALYQLRMVREVAIWFHRTFGNDPNFNPGAFIPPPDPHQETAALKTELERLRKERAESVQASEDQTRRLSELEVEVNQTKADALTWQALAEEIEAKAREDREKLDAQLAALQAQAVASPATTHGLIQRAQAAVQKLSLSEADTRRQIDVQLQEAGWEADSEALHYQKGVRPQAGRNLAIAEWPTGNGYADYVLFIGLTPVAVVEAKRRHTDIPGAIEQAKRYSRSYVIHGDECLPGGAWGSYKVPFLFATNGRPYLRQVETKSGIWFLDGRSPKNHPRALEGWYTPEGLEALLAQNHDTADAALQADSPDYLPLYDFQLEAIRAIEAALAQGQREILLAMATGTGKTRTCVSRLPADQGQALSPCAVRGGSLLTGRPGDGQSQRHPP